MVSYVKLELNWVWGKCVGQRTEKGIFLMTKKAALPGGKVGSTAEEATNAPRHKQLC